MSSMYEDFDESDVEGNDEDIGALGSILSWEDDEDGPTGGNNNGGGGGNDGISQHRMNNEACLYPPPDTVQFSLKDGSAHFSTSNGNLNNHQRTLNSGHQYEMKHNETMGNNLTMRLPVPTPLSTLQDQQNNNNNGHNNNNNGNNVNTQQSSNDVSQLQLFAGSNGFGLDDQQRQGMAAAFSQLLAQQAGNVIQQRQQQANTPQYGNQSYAADNNNNVNTVSQNTSFTQNVQPGQQPQLYPGQQSASANQQMSYSSNPSFPNQQQQQQNNNSAQPPNMQNSQFTQQMLIPQQGSNTGTMQFSTDPNAMIQQLQIAHLQQQLQQAQQQFQSQQQSTTQTPVNMGQQSQPQQQQQQQQQSQPQLQQGQPMYDMSKHMNVQNTPPSLPVKSPMIGSLPNFQQPQKQSQPLQGLGQTTAYGNATFLAPNIAPANNTANVGQTQTNEATLSSGKRTRKDSAGGGSGKHKEPKPSKVAKKAEADDILVLGKSTGIISASDTECENSKFAYHIADQTTSGCGKKGKSTDGIDTSNMTEEERAKVNRDRNREHARNTRLRKKAYLEKLKSTVDELCRERDTLVAERTGAASLLVEMHNTRTEVLMSFFALRSKDEKRRNLWSSILDESCFVCVMPVTPYRSFSASEVQISKCQRTIQGIDGIMADTSSLHVLFNSLANRSQYPDANVEFRYTLVTEESVVAGNQLMARWVMTTSNAMQFGAKNEVSKQGMLCCRFNSSHKITGLELMFDVMAFMLQLKQAVGSENFSVVPNTVQTCQRNFDMPMTITMADPPFTIMQVNTQWEEMTGYTADDVVGKYALSVLYGQDTNKETAETLTNEVIHKRSASATMTQYKKSGTKFCQYFDAYPLCTDSRITHYLTLTSYLGSENSLHPVSGTGNTAVNFIKNSASDKDNAKISSTGSVGMSNNVQLSGVPMPTSLMLPKSQMSADVNMSQSHNIPHYSNSTIDMPPPTSSRNTAK